MYLIALVLITLYPVRFIGSKPRSQAPSKGDKMHMRGHGRINGAEEKIVLDCFCEIHWNKFYLPAPGTSIQPNHLRSSEGKYLFGAADNNS